MQLKTVKRNNKRATSLGPDLAILSDLEKTKYSRRLQGNNMHEGFLDMDVKYEKRRYERAIEARHREQQIQAENLEKREVAADL